jgi:PAS domain S-box-containing protein
MKGGWAGELTAKATDGQTFPTLVAASPVADKEGKVFGMLGIFKDITERKRVEEELASSEEFLNSVIEQSPVSLWISDSKGTMIKLNQSCRELFGATDEEAVGEYNLFKDNLIEEQGFMPLVENVFEKGEVARFTIDYDLPRVEHVEVHGATHRILDVIVSPIKDVHGKVTNAIVQHKDITEIKRAEEALQEAMADLERSNAELEQFAYVASHDLQEPLRMVSSFTQLLSQRYKGKLDADADDFVTYAVDGANRMQRMISDLLAYSRVGTRGKPLELTYCEVVFDHTLANMKLAIEESGAMITHDPLPSVMADDSQLVQLFQNLIDNAIKFRGDQPLQVHVGVESKDGEWVFSVRDNGIGIDPQYKDRIFVIFQKLHVGGQYPGTGVGLATCRKIVERHGGRIWVESEPGKGATFYFTMPNRGG